MTQSRVTRGKTRAGRLRLLDPWFAAMARDLAAPPVVVDVGIGAEPDTTLELLEALRHEHTGASVFALDVDAERVDRLAARRVPGVVPVHGGFGTPLDRPAHLVRAANLLRQYRIESVPDALNAMAQWLRPDGLLVEGTTDRGGDRGVFRVLGFEDGALVPRALILFCAARPRGFAPRALTPYLPRGLGWHGHPGPGVKPLFDSWNTAFREVRDVPGADRFAASCAALSRSQVEVISGSSDHAQGRLVVRWRG